MMTLPRYSMGIGDRFGREGVAQLQALQAGAEHGIHVTPVWNKSYREHEIIGTRPQDVRLEADAAVRACGWGDAYFVDADHIGLRNVDLFVDASDFFTLDVADFTGESAGAEAVAAFVSAHASLVGEVTVPGLPEPLRVSRDQAVSAAERYLLAVREAGRIYRHILRTRRPGSFVTEVSMDETDAPQTPVELLFILAAVADEGIPAQTVAPKFSGRFNKGVDYVGEVDRFAREFEADLAVLAFAVERFGLPPSLKLSVHSGSDKFSLYGPVRDALARTGAGLHLKTAGTTWLEELIGLALSGPDGLALAKEICASGYARREELCRPYATVIDIEPLRLPAPEDVAAWSGVELAAALRHDPSCPRYNPDLRQLLHVAYRVAAEMGDRFLDALAGNADTIAEQVRTNLLERHILRVFPHGRGD